MLITEKYRGPDLIGGCKDLGFACKRGSQQKFLSRKLTCSVFSFKVSL